MLSILLNLLSVKCNEAVYQNYNIGGELINSSQSNLQATPEDSLHNWASMMFEAPRMNINPLLPMESNLKKKEDKKPEKKKPTKNEESSDEESSKDEPKKQPLRKNTTESSDEN
jgi:hypothetical protein